MRGLAWCEDRFERAEEDVQVARERPVLHVVQVQADGVLPGQGGTPADLPQSAHPRLHDQTTLRGVVVERHLALALRARSDQAHGAEEDVEQLRKLIERELAQDAPHRGDARIVLHLEQRRVRAPLLGEERCELCVGADDHGAELHHLEGDAVHPDALLTVEDRAAAGGFHEDRDRDEDGGEEKDQGPGPDHVERALGDDLGTGVLRCLHVHQGEAGDGTHMDARAADVGEVRRHDEMLLPGLELPAELAHTIRREAALAGDEDGVGVGPFQEVG
ncbi:hypothetical protein ABE10_00215, partial [Bacillus toyonensis]|nr:hypothetical protein [Bacillus toyonensis]